MVVKKNNKNKLFIVFMLVVAEFFMSCNVNKSEHKDLETGAYSKGNGITCKNVQITTNGKLVKKNQFVYGERVNLVFNDVKGLKKLDSLIYPGLSMHIIKNEKDTLVAKPDLLEKLKNGVKLSPLQLRAAFKAALPYKNKEEYKVLVNIWDNKGEGRFSYQLPFSIEKNKVLNVQSLGINYSKVYLYNETLKQIVTSKEINSNHTFILVVERVDGLIQKDQRVFPVFSIEMGDSKGNKIISNTNVLERYESGGVLADDLKVGRLTAKITFTKGNFNNPYKLRAKFGDRNSSKKIDILGNLIIN
ncbi:hypothetical protein SAMN04489761_0118 [Tenacibaculum sp. MAR_2009_124]|uniref:hypothetical protein n=1 Tax=Tenacibaculum sp. MAR_2009_124 TaxID=1250059 RepID=UPI00089B8A90|nr:hypothetical protein [Tenacibaculum sp. MAR_2009_124]SEB36063.1 hypothetical protein SAMN04489761_0118 [Tenacibaculum sp. MAR_2009_124]